MEDMIENQAARIGKIVEILIKRQCLLAMPAPEDAESSAYFAAYLYGNFGIKVDKPWLLSQYGVKEIAKLYKLNVPDSFYANPQDTKYYTCGELLANQIVSYYLAYGAENSAIDLFKEGKSLPDHSPDGSEIKVREFRMLTPAEAKEELRSIAKAYCDYKRPWSEDEEAEFTTLYDEGFYGGQRLLCGDNAVAMLPKDEAFAKSMTKNDLVKLSVARCGESKRLTIDKGTKALIRKALPYVRDCPMSKKQAKFYNTIVAKVDVGAYKSGKLPATNEGSPYKAAAALLRDGDVLGAAKVYAGSGSLLERNLKMLLSRANPVEATEILGMVDSKNPIALYQMASTLSADDGAGRTFVFTKNRLVKRHKETEYESRWRKSKLNESTKALVHDVLYSKIVEGYKAQPKLGKAYVSEGFHKVGVPINTSASGKGIDVFPAGSRIPVRGNAIRTFVHWERAFDIDSSLIFVDNDGRLSVMYFGNYYGKGFGNDVLFSGDITGPTGTEYYDIRLEGLKERGIKYVIQTFHGFCSSLNSGEIYCGYQDKKNLSTKAWDPKNIELKIHVKGDTRAFMSFGIDLTTDEVVIFNALVNSEDRVVSEGLAALTDRYLSPSCLELNMGLIAECRATELVDSPEEADVVFDADYKPAEGQKVVRPYDVEKLAAIASGASL